jgi:hypothetical protein
VEEKEEAETKEKETRGREREEDCLAGISSLLIFLAWVFYSTSAYSSMGVEGGLSV